MNASRENLTFSNSRVCLTVYHTLQSQSSLTQQSQLSETFPRTTKQIKKALSSQNGCQKVCAINLFHFTLRKAPQSLTQKLTLGQFLTRLKLGSIGFLDYNLSGKERDGGGREKDRESNRRATEAEEEERGKKSEGTTMLKEELIAKKEKNKDNL